MPSSDENMSPAELRTLTIVHYEAEWDPNAKGIWDTAAAWVNKQSNVAIDKLETNLKQFCETFLLATSKLDDLTAAYELSEIELSIDVTSKGEVRLISSAGAEIKGGIKLVFSRKNSK